MHTGDLREVDRLAVRHSVDLARRASVTDLDRPTPCDAWTLGELLTHMASQHRGFAAAAAGRGADPAVWVVPAVGPDAVVRYAEAADAVLEAFANVADLDQGFALPGLSTEVTYPARLAIGFHFIDYVAHGWDVARSLGLAFVLPADVIDAALPIARAVPDGPGRCRPDAIFGPALPAPHLGPLDQIVAMLGRSPTWTPAPDVPIGTSKRRRPSP